MPRFIRSFLKDKSGATAIEYALIIALIVIAIIVAITEVGTKMSASYNNTANAFPG